MDFDIYYLEPGEKNPPKDDNKPEDINSITSERDTLQQRVKELESQLKTAKQDERDRCVRACNSLTDFTVKNEYDVGYREALRNYKDVIIALSDDPAQP